MKVLITGPFGNVGNSLLRELSGRGHDVRCFDLPTASNRKAAKRLGIADVVWGDIRQPVDVAGAVAGCDIVVHLAAIIPPGSDHDPATAEADNVGGTTNVINAVAAAPVPPKLIYASSLALFGPTQHQPPPRTLVDPIKVTDHYTRHKAACEALLHDSGLQVAILRFGAVIPLAVLGAIDPLMFEVPLTDRIEFVHTWDVGLALANAIDSSEIWGRTFLIGGGPRCQLYQRELISKPLEAVGIGMLPDAAFGTTPYHTDWLDTTESQAVLQYQRFTFDDYVRDMLAVVGWRRRAIRPLRPIIRRALLRKSTYLRAASRRAG